MRRATKGIIVTFAVSLLTIFLFIPAIPSNHSYSWETICPTNTELCSLGDGSLLVQGFGSFSYRLFGVGGWWGVSQWGQGYQLFSSNSSLHLVVYSLPWFFQGAYANYSGVAKGPNGNMTEAVEIRVAALNQTKVEYHLMVTVAGQASVGKITWLDKLEPLTSLLCQSADQPVPANVTIGGIQVLSYSYKCLIEPNDYGMIYIGNDVPFILRFSHFLTVSSYSEDWSISNTNIPGLLT